MTSRRGSVGIVFTLLTPVLVAATGLAVEYGSALSVRTQNQRIADAAAYSGALAFDTASDPTAGIAAATSAASNVVTTNGLSRVTTDVAQIPSPTDPSRRAIRVTISQKVPLVFAAMYAGRSTQAVPVSSAAELIDTAGPDRSMPIQTAATPDVAVSSSTRISVEATGAAI